MQLRPIFFLALLFSSVFFSGCFQIFYDIIQKPDGSFQIRETIGFGKQFFEAMASFGSIADSSHSNLTAQMMIDSMRHSFAIRRDSLIQTAYGTKEGGIKSISTADTMIDTTLYFIMEADVPQVDSLPGAFRILSTSSEGINSEVPQKPSNDVRLKVSHPKEHTSLTFYVPPSDTSFMQMDIPGLADAFKGLSMHYRVYSPNLDQPKDKKIKQIPGGQERVLSAKELFKKGRTKHLDATFVLKDQP